MCPGLMRPKSLANICSETRIWAHTKNVHEKRSRLCFAGEKKNAARKSNNRVHNQPHSTLSMLSIALDCFFFIKCKWIWYDMVQIHPLTQNVPKSYTIEQVYEYSNKTHFFHACLHYMYNRILAPFSIQHVYLFHIIF